MRKKKAAESKSTVSTVVNTFKPKPDNSYAQFNDKLAKESSDFSPGRNWLL